MTTPHRPATGVGRQPVVRLARACVRAKILALGLVLVAAVFALLGTARGAGPTERVIILQPGLNTVGWVGEAAGVADLFAELPEATAVYAWDPINQRYLIAAPFVPESLWTLSDVTPGMGFLVSINGDDPVEWRLPLTPVSGTVRLWPGLNLVAWSGKDNTPLTHALRGVGTSAAGVFVERDGVAGWTNTSSPDASASDHVDHLALGEALWVRSSRRVNWLQPTDVLPQITADVSDADRARVVRALQDAAAYFDQTYGIQADPARLKLSFRSAPDWPHAGGGVDWFPVPEIAFTNVHHFTEGWLRTFVTHEYVHILQAQLDTTSIDYSESGETYKISAGIVAPWWMKEGTAFLAADARLNPVLLDRARALVTNASAPLQTIVRQGSLPYEAYSHGALAMQKLSVGASDDSLFEFWRLLASPGGSATTWEDLIPIWKSAFEEAFDVEIDEFYHEFHQWQCAQAVNNGHPETDDCLMGAQRLVRGTLSFDCQLGGSNQVRLLRQAGDEWSPLDWWQADAGYFALAAPTAGLYLIQVRYADIEPYFGASGMSATVSDAVPWQVDHAGIDVALSRLQNRDSCSSPE